MQQVIDKITSLYFILGALFALLSLGFSERLLRLHLLIVAGTFVLVALGLEAAFHLHWLGP